MARPRSFDEDRVVRDAREAFADRGYAATSVEELTAATGLRRSSLYGAFGDKHGLFVRVFDDYCSDAMGAVVAELEGDDAGAAARLAAHLRGKVADPEASRRGCLLARETAELAGADPDVDRIAGGAFATYEAALTRCVAQAQASGELRSDLDPATAGALLLAVLRGFESLGRAGHPPEALQASADAALALLAA